ncbi:MAG: type III pantothenate kinase, partial [Clostridiales bacterium]|nr:type III pantothenate kinase [Clostridiales bacterium]
MILAVDAGNTHIVIGCLDSRKKHFVGRISTNRQGTADEYAMLMKNLLDLNGVSPASIEGSILANVVPQISHILSGALERLVGRPPVVVGPGVKTGLNIKIDDPGQLGADLVAVGVAAMAKYPLPLIVFDLGTATSVSVINKNGLY